MTANELADKLGMVRIGLTLEAATMLRQQAKEIEMFKLLANKLKERVFESPEHFEKYIKKKYFSELTDEEILDTARTMLVIDGATMEEAYVLFARAILSKAQGANDKQ